MKFLAERKYSLSVLALMISLYVIAALLHEYWDGKGYSPFPFIFLGCMFVSKIYRVLDKSKSKLGKRFRKIKIVANYRKERAKLNTTRGNNEMVN